MLETFRGSSLRTLSPLKDQAHNVLMPYAFKKIQKEFERATQYSVHQENHMNLCYNIIKMKIVKSTRSYGMVR